MARERTARSGTRGRGTKGREAPPSKVAGNRVPADGDAARRQLDRLIRRLRAGGYTWAEGLRLDDPNDLRRLRGMLDGRFGKGELSQTEYRRLKIYIIKLLMQIKPRTLPAPAPTAHPRKRRQRPSGLPKVRPRPPAPLSHLAMGPHADAGLASFTAGLLAAAAFMALSLGPGWVGFFVGFLPVSLLASWAVASHA